jgi:TrmH family RNA methyltransferase
MTQHHTLLPIITSARNRRIVEAGKLTQRKYRQQQNRFLVEGLQLLHMALDAGLTPVEVFFCDEQFTGTEAPALLARFAETSADLVPVSARIMDKISQRTISHGIAATFALFDTPLGAVRLTGHDLVIVLDRLQYPGNIGTVVRTADAVGASLVIVLGPCADIFDPKSIRGSMGSLFTLPVVCSDDVPPVFDWLKRAGLRFVGADPACGSWDMPTGGAALVLGNEARGLSDDVRPYLTDWARLPIVGHAESLNVAVAGGVLMYAWLRANQ